MKTHTQLPVTIGKPFTPKRNIKPYQVEVICIDEECKAPCFCTAEGYSTRHLMRDHEAPHQHFKTQNAPANGSGWLERKASGDIVYHTPWLKTIKPFRDTYKALTPKPRIETPDKALARLRKECVTPPDATKHISGHGDNAGFIMTATNGHWALMEPGKGKGDPLSHLGISAKHRATFIDASEFHLALKRAAIMANPRSRTVLLIAKDDAVTLYSSDSDVGEFLEPIPAKITKAWRAAFDYQYLEMALGCWPLTVWVKDEESSTIFEPANSAWRFVLMPMRADFEQASKAIKNASEETMVTTQTTPAWEGY